VNILLFAAALTLPIIGIGFSALFILADLANRNK